MGLEFANMFDRQIPIQVDSLTKTYRNGRWSRRTVEALCGISFQVQPGEIFGLLGPNGAGKTTVIKILLGIVKKTGGIARILGQPAGKRSGRRKIGYLPEDLFFASHHTGGSALDYYGQLSGLSTATVRRNRDSLLEMVELTQWRRVPVRKYSKGMIQRLGLAQALLHDPDLLILDEPTDGLDPVGRTQVRSVLEELRRKGKTIFLNSHLLQEVEVLCDRVAILDHGALRCVGSVKEITNQINPQQIELIIDAIGTEEVIRQALGNRPIDQWKEIGCRQFRFVIRLIRQDDVDRCVDDLRRHGVSVAGLTRQRTSLEEAFLEILSNHGVSS